MKVITTWRGVDCLGVFDVVMSALASADERTADLERTVYLKPIGEPEAH